MKVGICSVGSELVSGEIADSNAAWLAQRTLESGCGVAAEVIVGDDRRDMLDAFAWLAERADVLVIGGGLGPTSDDLTRYVVGEFAEVPLERREQLERHLEAVYARLERDMPPAALNQADIPLGAEVFEPEGTAAGFTLTTERNDRELRIFVLPGVPWEYRGIAEREILPHLVRRSGGQARVTRTVHVAGLGESGVGEALTTLTDRLEAARRDTADPAAGVEVSFLAASHEVQVRVTATGPSPQAARERAEPVVQEVVDRLGDAVTSVDEQRLEHEVARLLLAMGRTVATAESFTSGRVAAMLSSVPGASGFLQGGVAAYQRKVKVEMLGVERELVERHGPVSRETVEAMARGARERLGADYGVATTGVAGPTVNPGDPPVGTALWAIAQPDGEVHIEERHIPAGDRDIIQVRGAAFALESLRRCLARERAGTVRVTP